MHSAENYGVKRAMEMTETSLFALRKALDNKEISAVELTKAYLARIEKADGQLQSFITVTADRALADAQAAQKIIDRGEAKPLTGIAAAVKDNICTEGIATTCGSKMLADFVPPYSAAAVEKLREQGCVLVGKTSLDEFAMGSDTQTSAFAKTKNPFDLTKVPGGSSGGSAAAVSAGLVPVALGSDTGGSIRQPASFCGVTGLKPTYGRVSRYGLVAFASSLDQIGPIGRSAADCAVMMNAISGRDSRDASSRRVPVPDFCSALGKGVKGLKIAVPEEFYSDAVDDKVKTAVLAAAKEYERQGAQLVPCSMPSLKYAVCAYYLIACAEAASNLSRYDGVRFGLKGKGASYGEMVLDSRNRGFGDEVKRRILLGNYALSSGFRDAYYRKACALRQRISAEYDSIFRQADLILTPTAPTCAYSVGENARPTKAYAADFLTVTANLAGLPAISTTCGYDKDGMPIGMSLTGRAFDELTVIRAADCFERLFTPVYPQAE